MLKQAEPSDLQYWTDKVTAFLQEAAREGGYRGAVLGVSGGLDSAVAAFLAARAFPPERLKLFYLPERDSNSESGRDARRVAEALGLELRNVSIGRLLDFLQVYEGPIPFWVRWGALNRFLYRGYSRIKGEDPFVKGLGQYDEKWLSEVRAYYRIKHRLRAAVLYHEAERRRHMVIGCINRTEFLTGFFVPHGDMAADVFPLLPFYKAQVRQLAEYLGVPRPILEKKPSPDLIPGLDDEFVLGLDYETLDRVLPDLEAGYSGAEVAARNRVSPALADKFAEVVELAKKLHAFPPYPRLEGIPDLKLE